ncbi:PAS domain S-box protein [Algoriphagus sp. AK58]|uniref:PAS domain S-box protein n=1 Tax=Algoriphagus sp. AK58 TaxID=1406877 RepID=UPI00164F16B4|nr:PAS domain S-box protein [Algoriphagus sp. AK58]
MQASKALRESAEKYTSLFEKMPEGVVYQDSEGKIIDANPAAQQLLGLTLEQLQGRTSVDPRWHAIHQDGLPFPGDIHPAMVALKTGKVVENVVMGIFNPLSNDYRWILINSTPEFKQGASSPHLVFSSFTDITRQIEAERKIKAQSELMELLVFTSTSFINIPEEKFNETIQLSLQKLGEFVEADRMYVFEYDWEKHTCSNTFEWCSEGIEPQIEILQQTPLEGLEDWTENHLKGEMMYVKDVFSLDENATLRQILEPQGVKSLLAMPIMDSKDCIGFIGLDSVKKHHTYSENEINLLRIFTGILANVNNRFKRERELKERIKELNSIYQISNLTIQKNLPEKVLFQEIVNIMPSGFYNPKVTSARIIYLGQNIESPHFILTQNFISEKFLVNDQEIGWIEVFIPEREKFLPEEKTVLKTIANTLNQHLEVKQNLDAIRKSEERLRNLVNSQTNFVIRTDLKGRHTFWNKKFEEDFGYLYPTKGLESSDSLTSICEYDKDKATETVVKCIESPGKVFQVELDKPTKSGKIMTTLWDFVCITDSAGNPFEMQCVGIDISDRKNTERELSKFRLISDKATYGSVITDHKTRIISYCNEAFAKMHGYEVEELIGKEILTLHTEEQLESYFGKIYPEFLKNGEYSAKEFGRKRKDGSTFPGLVSTKLYLDENGNPLFNASTVIDMSEQKIIEEKIKEQNLRLKAIIDAIPDILYILDSEGNYLEYFSSNLENYIGDFSYLIGKNLKEVFEEDQAFLHLNKIQLALKEKKIQTYEYAGMRGFEGRFFESRIVPMTENKILRFVREITDRKKNESEIRKLTLAIEQSPVAIIITDLKGNLEYMSPSFLKMTGYSTEELKGKPVGIIKSGMTERKVYNDLWKTICSGNNWQNEWQNRRKNGELYWEHISITPIFDEKNRIKNFLGVKQDITERKRIEEEILELNFNLERRIAERTQELENSNKELEMARIEADSANQAKSEFLSRMSHELRTPMNSILGFAQLLELTELKASQKKNLEYIIKSGNHLLQLINEVLDIARIESGKVSISLESIDLLHLINEVVESVTPFALKKSITITSTSLTDSKTFVWADVQRLKQILINLLNNAIKYNKEDGSVSIYLEHLSDQNGKECIRINVEDNGIGISEDDLPKLFKPFERVGDANHFVEGTGLGLSVVEKLTKLIKGKVGVESQIGKGSRFWIELPAAPQDSGKLESHTHEQSSIIQLDAQTQGALLLIEDNISNIELIKELLASLKPEIQLIYTMYGSEALELAKKHKPSLILLDLNLPDISGGKVLEILKSDEETRFLPVSVVSADATAKQIEGMTEKGAEHYITKPINISQIIKLFDLYFKKNSND